MNIRSVVASLLGVKSSAPLASMSERTEPVIYSGMETKDSEPQYGITIDMLASRNSNHVSESRAMKIEAFYSCVRDKAEMVGKLPMKLYRVTRNSREQILQGRTKRIFTERPCEYMSMQNFLEMLVATYERRGVFYAYIERNDRGDVMSLIPFANQDAVSSNMDINGNVYYTYFTNDNRSFVAGTTEDLFIVSMFTLDGYTPVSPIVHCATLLGIAVAQDDTYKESQEKGITSQMALSTEQVFKDPNALQRIKDQLKEMRGPRGLTEIPIFEQGMKPISLKLTPQESELLGNRNFTISRICSMTRVPPHRIGIKADNGTKSTAAELDEAYMRDSLDVILVKIEHALNELSPDGYKIEFNRKSFYAGSPWRLVEAVEKEVKGGLASINEGRTDLGREPIEGGDIFAIDNNNVTYGLWTEVKEIQSQLYGRQNPQQGDKPAENTPTDTEESEDE